MSELIFLTKSDDLDIVRLSLGALGNLSEDKRHTLHEKYAIAGQ
jgi:hypothetical protein